MSARGLGASAEDRLGIPALAPLALIALLAVTAAPVLAAGDEKDCEAWPGEYSPLPTVYNDDPFAAHWARLRARELSKLALEFESEDRVQAHRLWRRISCLVPDGPEVLAGMERTQPRAVRREAPPAPVPLAELDRALRRAEKEIEDARFRDAIESAAAAQRLMERLSPSPELSERRVRLGLLEATAFMAFGNQTAARKSFEQVLAHDPELSLDARSTPPKVRRAPELLRPRRVVIAQNADKFFGLELTIEDLEIRRIER
ncbi:MAG: hypothetical protein O7A09_04190, partial [Proteobacteria bacterium]|nr:hypothetical protein [Pseudomonadota bacterium]